MGSQTLGWSSEHDQPAMISQVGVQPSSGSSLPSSQGSSLSTIPSPQSIWQAEGSPSHTQPRVTWQRAVQPSS